MWVVMLPGEYAETSELYGCYRSEQKAEAEAKAWNDANPRGDRACVMPVWPSRLLRDAKGA